MPWDDFVLKFPGIERPTGRVPFKTKLMWTGIILVSYYILAEIPIFGLTSEAVDYFAQLRAILAGKFGSIMTLGIGPIVTASILLQLMVGTRIVNWDMSNPYYRAKFQGWQKMLAVIFIFVEAVPWVASGRLGGSATIARQMGVSIGFLNTLIIFQLFLGGSMVLLMDEVVSKWGIGSGVGLFIAAGVCQEIVVGIFNPLPSKYTPNVPAGRLFSAIYYFNMGSPGNAVRALIPIIGTVVTFLLVVYAETMRVEIPVSYGGIKGIRSRYPIRFVYASNIPVILMGALLANFQMIGRMLADKGITIFGQIGSNGEPISGLLLYLSPPYQLITHLVVGGYVSMTEIIQAVCYMSVMVLGSMAFAHFWIMTTGMGPSEIATRLQSQGLQIPGFRKDRRILERVLSRYIPVVTLLGGAFVGFLAAFADFTGALGHGTGVLLTVGILYRMYEQIAQEQMMDVNPMIRRFIQGG